MPSYNILSEDSNIIINLSLLLNVTILKLDTNSIYHNLRLIIFYNVNFMLFILKSMSFIFLEKLGTDIMLGISC